MSGASRLAARPCEPHLVSALPRLRLVSARPALRAGFPLTAVVRHQLLRRIFTILGCASLALVVLLSYRSNPGEYRGESSVPINSLCSVALPAKWIGSHDVIAPDFSRVMTIKDAQGNECGIYLSWEFATAQSVTVEFNKREYVVSGDKALGIKQFAYGQLIHPPEGLSYEAGKYLNEQWPRNWDRLRRRWARFL